MNEGVTEKWKLTCSHAYAYYPGVLRRIEIAYVQFNEAKKRSAVMMVTLQGGYLISFYGTYVKKDSVVVHDYFCSSFHPPLLLLSHL